MLNTLHGQSVSVAESIRQLSGVIVAEKVSGPYDVICIIEATDLSSLGSIITLKIKNVPGIKNSFSCLAL